MFQFVFAFPQTCIKNICTISSAIKISLIDCLGVKHSRFDKIHQNIRSNFLAIFKAFDLERFDFQNSPFISYVGLLC